MADDPKPQQASTPIPPTLPTGTAPPAPTGLIFPDATAPRLTLDTLPEGQKCRIQALVRGGTTTGAYDKEMQQRLADAEVRRAEDEADRKIAQIPIEKGGGLMFERKLTDETSNPRVHVTYVGRTKEKISEQLCELVFDELMGDHMLIFVCPECSRRGVPSGFAQCHAKSKHRSWHVDTRGAGEVKAVRNSDSAGGIEYYVSAGTIMDTDVLRCDGVNCGCAFKIHKNVMYRV